MRRAWLYTLAALILGGCAALPAIRSVGEQVLYGAPSATAEPSRTRRPTRTPRATETVAVSPSPTETIGTSPTPTIPLLPSFAPTLAPTSSLPFVVLSSTPAVSALPATPLSTPTPAAALDCKLIWQSPHNGVTFNPGDKWSTGWNIKNIGTTTWQTGAYEFFYVGGSRLDYGDRVPLQTSVSPGDTIVLSVPMKAPKSEGMYTTHWGIRQGELSFCYLTLTILVQNP